MELYSPRQLEVYEVPPKVASNLNARWHSVLPKIHYSNITRSRFWVCYGAFFQKECVAVGIWSSPIAENRMKDGKSTLELRRLAISPEAPKYTASRMLSIMRKAIQRKFPNITKLISYQDTEVHQGTIYKASGWHIEAEVPYRSWSETGRKRNPSQSTARKVRWAYDYS